MNTPVSHGQAACRHAAATDTAVTPPPYWPPAKATTQSALLHTLFYWHTLILPRHATIPRMAYQPRRRVVEILRHTSLKGVARVRHAAQEYASHAAVRRMPPRSQPGIQPYSIHKRYTQPHSRRPHIIDITAAEEGQPLKAATHTIVGPRGHTRYCITPFTPACACHLPRSIATVRRIRRRYYATPSLVVATTLLLFACNTLIQYICHE